MTLVMLRMVCQTVEHLAKQGPIEINFNLNHRVVIDLTPNLKKEK